MEVGCELEVDVNGEETFMVDKKILVCFSGKFRKLFAKLTSSGTSHLKVIFHNFPGGADGFELVTRFCYNNGEIEITPSNIVMLNSAANFMEMGMNYSSVKPNLVDQTEKFLEGINYWTWSELLLAIKQCQDLFTSAENSTFVVFEKVLDSTVGRLALPTVGSPFARSSENFSSQFSSEISSTCSTTNCSSSTTWWFQDLLFLNLNLFEKATQMMVSQKLDHTTVFKFLIFYTKSRFCAAGVLLSEKRQILEVVINLLSLLNRTCISCKGLFYILGMVSNVKKISKFHKLELERLIGSKLDEATLDHILIRSPRRNEYTYDVDLVLRLVECYFLEDMIMIPSRMKHVSRLIDSFLIEVASDTLLKPSKFAELVMVIPDSARECCDVVYQAIELYLEVHTRLCREEKMKLCSTLHCDKLSAGALKHLSQSSMFHSRPAIQNRFYSFETVNAISDETKCSKFRSLPKLCSC
ncbi:BTB/POZ domain-containing protein At3g22104-like [Mercurialis annua]|uniref:BTB/POZ domain-containing protein At3g22104-like n=1 Tax=Mercurialis annua TaxID=3986 RepID=UPI0021606BC6|nr:BTB/POZ domain-containing protein At3g22104-like [Mercurialis annua]